VGEEFETVEPSGTRTDSSHSSASSDSTTPLSPHFTVGHHRYRSSYETPSPSPSLTLPVRKRYRGTLVRGAS
ncbi:hypothetical protein Tco_0479762, partial [Tanacetum coccineum]